jgi:hypothetical protein
VLVCEAEETAQNVRARTSRNLQKLRFMGTCEIQESARKKPGNDGMVRVRGDAIGAESSPEDVTTANFLQIVIRTISAPNASQLYFRVTCSCADK